MKLLRFWGVVLLLLPLQLATAFAAAPVCGLCITEVQTQGIGGATEEYITLTNNTASPYDMAGHIVRYATASGSFNSKTIGLSGSLAAQASVSYVSDVLKSSNLGVQVFPIGLAMADAGGSLQIVKNNLVIDQVAWGTSSVSYSTPAATTALPHERGWSIVRQIANSGAFLDSGDDRTDFKPTQHACTGISLNEIQPLLIDASGGDVVRALEVVKLAEANTLQDCPISMNGVVYQIAAGDIGSGAGLAVITAAITAGQVAALSLSSEATNNFQFVPQSVRGGVVLAGSVFAQPVLASGQSYAKFTTGFKATYKPTIGAPNVLQTAPTAVTDVTVPEEPVCDGVIINELLPNPVGEDSGQEWVEFTATGESAVSLAGCVLRVNATDYKFSADQFVEPDQFLVLGVFGDGVSAHTLSLRNGDTNTVSIGHISLVGGFVASQTIQYSDAPEGQTWARFDDGWRWVTPTSGAANALSDQAPEPTLSPTEPPAQVVGAGVVAATQADVQLIAATLNITELLPNPAAPLTDDSDEFVELHNPNDQPVNLTNYKIQTGNNYSYSYTFVGGTLAAHQYLAVYSRDSGLVLSNASGVARLLDPTGQIVSQTDPYDAAKDGQTWALISDSWQWTITPTPGAVNTASIPVIATASALKAAKSSATTTPKTATPKAPAKVASAKTTKTTTTPERQVYQDPPQAPPSIHPGILASVGVITLLYAAYEYRSDAVNYYRRFRRYRALRRATRTPAAGR